MTETKIHSSDSDTTIYLFDEYHGCDDCTDENIRHAEYLLDRSVVLAGVEGFAGGRRYDSQDGEYVDEWVSGECTDATQIGSYPNFANALMEKGHRVTGVDCRGLSDEIEIDIVEGRFSPEDVAEHPNQRRRSIHFLTTLITEADNRDLGGDLLLNCGSDHNMRIQEMLMSGKTPDPEWESYNYVRFRCDAFDDC